MVKRLSVLAVSALLLAAPASPAFGGAVSPVEDCGSVGTPRQVRVSGHEGVPPVEMQVGKDTRFEFDFTPSRDQPNAEFTMVAETAVGEIPVEQHTMVKLATGKTYTVRHTVRPTDLLAGQQMKIRAKVTSGNRTEMCVKILVNVRA